MATAAGHHVTSNLAMHEGRALYSAAEAIIKAILEAEREIALLAGTDGPSGDVFASARKPATEELLRRHGTAVVASSLARRSLQVAMRVAASGDCAIVCVPNKQLHLALRELGEASKVAIASGASRQTAGSGVDRSADVVGGALCVVLEDDATGDASLCPKQIARSLAMPCIEPASVSQLRDAIDQSMRLSRAGGCAVAIVVHHQLLRSTVMLEARPNRILSAVDVPLLRRRRRQRIAETGGVLRMARRMELNSVRALPSPGERVSVGFITIGPADAALEHLTQVLRLHGRVPVLHLGLVTPLDEALLERFITRCEQIVVLEARPGTMQADILGVAEKLRDRTLVPASIWGRLIPPRGDDAARPMLIDEALHSSTLARKIVHLLHSLRPALQVTSKLASAPPELLFAPSPRGSQIGENAARAAIRRLVTDVDQRLRSESVDQQPVRNTVLKLDVIGLFQSTLTGDRIVPVEICRAGEFRDFGAALISAAAAAGRPAILVVLDLESEAGQLERLARAQVAPEHTEKVSIVPADLTARLELRDRLYEAALLDHLSILVLRDGKPPRFSLTGLERMLSDTDKLGFEPRQWLIRPADDVCAIRDVVESEDAVPQESSSGAAATEDLRRWLESDAHGAGTSLDSMLPSDRQELDRIMRTHHVVEKLSKRQSKRMRVKVQPLLEQIEVTRTRPPAYVWRRETQSSLELPTPLHAKQSVWRIHLSGWRGHGPGVAARVLCEAGRNMGYEVRAMHDPTIVAAGYRAWAQVLFTRASSEAHINLSPQIPYGEADVLLGVDWQETLRAINPLENQRVASTDRTCTIVNIGTFQADTGTPPTVAERASVTESIRAVSQDTLCAIHDYASACRTWFYTDRVTDLAMLGSAFQLGFVPVRLDAIEAALQRLEATGFGRSLEAFEFGRWLAVDDRLMPHGRKRRGAVVEELHRQTRRMVLSVRSSRWGGRSIARRFQRLLEQALVSTPGLSETAAGRQAHRDMVAALYRCLEWGGMEYANRYGQLVMNLYRADRGEKGRALTRDAVLPLAEAMLVRDPVYLASMAASPEQRRRLQSTTTIGSYGGGLNVKRSRGDQVERRYLTRIEFIGFGRRVRLDLRTSDWPSRVAKASRLILPQRWRGTRRDRELREYMISLVQQATYGSSDDYDTWAEAMHRLHTYAVEQRLRSMAVSEVRMLVDGKPEPDSTVFRSNA